MAMTSPYLEVEGVTSNSASGIGGTKTRGSVGVLVTPLLCPVAVSIKMPSRGCEAGCSVTVCGGGPGSATGDCHCENEPSLVSSFRDVTVTPVGSVQRRVTCPGNVPGVIEKPVTGASSDARACISVRSL